MTPYKVTIHEKPLPGGNFWIFFTIFRRFLIFIAFHDLYIFIYYIHLSRHIQYLQIKTIYVIIACVMTSQEPKIHAAVYFYLEMGKNTKVGTCTFLFL